MRISRIIIKNFRNFKSLDVAVGDHLVVVGENRVGKTNLMYALRLVLDPALQDTARELRPEDFWDGLDAPMQSGSVIEIAVELADFEHDLEQLALLADFLVQPSPMVARLCYRYRPVEADEGEEVGTPEYEFITFGGEREDNPVSYEVRRRLPFQLLPALRDVESDLGSWRRSPLRPLLDSLASDIGSDALQELVGGVSAASGAILENASVAQLATSITSEVSSLTGEHQGVATSLGIASTDADRLIRSLRLLVDDADREVGEASLGSANVIYLALKSLELKAHVTAGTRNHTFWAIEEPEAHLHPQVQRRMFKSLLAPRAHEPRLDEQAAAASSSIVLTTHSPHVVSVAPLDSIVMLRSAGDPVRTVGSSASEADLSRDEVGDLERYIDATRAELLFARGVLLVEGDAERFLVPALAALRGHDLDGLGISVCAVGGTNFKPYSALLAELEVPHAILTDEDPHRGGRYAAGRIRDLLLSWDVDDVEAATGWDELRTLAEEWGVFVSDYTLEVALWRSRRHRTMSRTLTDLAPGETARARAAEWREDPDAVDVEQLLKDIGSIGKGRFAQRQAARMLRGQSRACPPPIVRAIDYLIREVGSA